MSKNKIPLTPVQLGLTLLNGAGLVFCITGDLFMLMFDRGTVNKMIVFANLVLAVTTAICCGILLQRAGDYDIFEEGEQRDKIPAVCALRTYFCMVESDLTIVLLMMLAGALIRRNTIKMIAVTAPLLFLLAVAVYYIRTRGYGEDEGEISAEPETQAPEKAALMKAADDIIAEEHTPRTADDILADIKADIAETEIDEAVASIKEKTI